MTREKTPGARRFTSRSVALTATFLALAAGGAAACDSSSGDDPDSFVSYDGGSAPGAVDVASGITDESADVEETDDADESDDAADTDLDADEVSDEVFYCADEDGEVVDADNCDEPDTAFFFLWHSAGYARGLAPGTMLGEGDYFAPGDRAARRTYGLPATGRVANSTVKTNIVGSSSGGSGVTAPQSSGG